MQKFHRSFTTLNSTTTMMSAIKQGESMPLQGGHSDTAMSSPIKNKRASSAIVRVMMMGTAVAVGVLLLIIAGPSKKMMLTNSSSNVVTAPSGLAE